MSINALLAASIGREDAPSTPISMEELEAALELTPPTNPEGELLEAAIDTATRSEATLLALDGFGDVEQTDAILQLKGIMARSALEPFGYSVESMDDVVVSQEGAVDKLKDFAKAIAEMIKKMVASVKQFFDKNLSNVGRMEKSIKALKAKVKAKPAKSEPKEDEITSSKFTRIGLANMDMVPLLENYAKFAVKELVANKELNDLGVTYSKAVSDSFKEDTGELLLNKQNGIIIAYAEGAIAALGLINASDDTYVLNLPGDVAWLALEYSNGNKDGDDMLHLGKFVAGYDEDVPDKIKLPAPTPSEITDVCEAAEKLAKSMLEQKDAARDLEKHTAVIQNVIANGMMRGGVTAQHGEGAAGVNNLLKGLRNVAINRAKVDQVVMKEAYRVLSAGYAYALDGYKNLD